MTAPAPDGAKRKAGSPPEGADARSKRHPADQPTPAPLLEERRHELAEVYAAYTALAAAPPGTSPPEQPYLRLLKAGQGEWARGGAGWVRQTPLGQHPRNRTSNAARMGARAQPATGLHLPS